jgi:hypothetical protein
MIGPTESSHSDGGATEWGGAAVCGIPAELGAGAGVDRGVLGGVCF